MSYTTIYYKAAVYDYSGNTQNENNWWYTPNHVVVMKVMKGESGARVSAKHPRFGSKRRGPRKDSGNNKKCHDVCE